ncbi:hypothetical protein SBOR_1751 [Sclerotinia borealis F-4128]|uniref:Uncharacterized protein n=1 Tax=Sclerotinia borealis (strain F-4128) TaxID=1432307 RepID=W9CTR6_SCLBF|nr:hypothetical protein SBOR_1751 [Sclerotinia borealis F-4128]
MKSNFKNIILILGLASLTATIPRERHDKDADCFSFHHHDEGDMLKPHHFNLELDCNSSSVSIDVQPSQLSLSCALISTRRMPDGTHDPHEFPIELKSGASFFRGKKIKSTMLQPFIISRSQIPDGEDRVAMLVGCVKIHRGWSKGQTREDLEIWCEVLQVEAADRNDGGESKME